MVKLNKTVKVSGRFVTPYLIQEDNVYCFDLKKDTIILPISSFKKGKTRKIKPIIPNVISEKAQAPQATLQKEPDKEIIIIKPNFEFTSIGGVRTFGNAELSVKHNTTEKTMEAFSYDGKGIVRTFGNADSSIELNLNFFKKYNSVGVVQVFGSSLNTLRINEPKITTPIDNNRYIRPTEEDDYI